MSLRSAIATTLYRLPDGVRGRLPRSVREPIRQRIGPFAPWEAGFSHAAPPPAPGEVVGPPQFVGIGAQKAGTTWWFGLIVAHPGVSHRSSIHKERHYFSRFATDRFGPEDVDTYHAWFPRAEGTITGEWTPDYAYHPWVPPLLARAAPGAKLVMIVRDPVERFLSGLAHASVTRASLLGDVVTEAVTRGFYAAEMRLWKKHFGPDQLLVLQYERCVEEASDQLKRTYRFLGLSDEFTPATLGSSKKASRSEKPELEQDARKRLVDVYAQDVEELLRLVPDLDVNLWPNFGGR